MITKIKLDNVASYKKPTELVTDKKVNLIYGLNGVGKSTLSDYLYHPDDSRFSRCSIEGLRESDSVLVYNNTFVQDTFYNSETIPGIFTLSKYNSLAQRNIEEARKKLADISKQKDDLQNRREQESDRYGKKIGEYKNKIWAIKTNYANEDKTLEFCLDGVKGSKEALFSHLLSVSKNAGKIPYGIEDLISEAQAIQNVPQIKALIPEIRFNIASVESNAILAEVIVGNKNAAISELIEKLGNSDWVNHGRHYIHFEGEEAVCPFCQQKTITREFAIQIRNYFDESYSRNVQIIDELNSKYDDKTSAIIETVKSLIQDPFLNDFRDDFEKVLSEMQKCFESNLSLLKEKRNTPSVVISMNSTSELETTLNQIINQANKQIEKHNQMIRNIKAAKQSIRDRFWVLIREEFNDVIDLYQKEVRQHKQNEKKFDDEADELSNAERQQKNVIADNQKKTLNIDDAVENIKRGLIDIGITGFSIERYSEDEPLYRLKRDDGNEKVFNTLSEGEKMIISFLYFVELCKGETSENKSSINKIVVIDDPISSLSHIYVFNIGRLIHNEFLRTNKYEQIFVLTHNLYFFYELTNIKHEERHQDQNLFRIMKNEQGSNIRTMKYEEIQNDYQAYWQIVKDPNQPPALIANCMRNIIEYFFGFVEKQSYAAVFKKKELMENRFQAFERYMNRESHSLGQNIFDIKEFDYDDFKDAFRKVFELTDYAEHYNKMMK